LHGHFHSYFYRKYKNIWNNSIERSWSKLLLLLLYNFDLFVIEILLKQLMSLNEYKELFCRII
jgi:hypothetical protein